MTWTAGFPYLCRIFDLSDKHHEDNYFQTARPVNASSEKSFAEWESRLSRLDEVAFCNLALRAAPLVTCRDKDKGRHWSALFEVLNEAKGYEFLLDKGYTHIIFVPPSAGTETPDLYATREGGIDVVLDVKTIRVSDSNITARRTGKEQLVVSQLPDGLKHKIQSHYDKACGQCTSFKPQAARKICYFCITVDPQVAGRRENHLVLEKFIRAIQRPDVETVLGWSGVWSR